MGKLTSKFHGTWWDLTRILAGSLIAALAFRCFTFPNDIVSGGITGIAQIINLLTGFPVGVAAIVMNIPLFAWAWKKLGRKFVVMTGICMAASSIFIDLLAGVVSPLTREPMLAAVYGGLVNGLGWGIVYTTGYTGGGIDIPARFLRRQYPHINFSTFVLGMNMVIILAFAAIFKKFESCMYTLICSLQHGYRRRSKETRRRRRLRPRTKIIGAISKFGTGLKPVLFFVSLN